MRKRTIASVVGRVASQSSIHCRTRRDSKKPMTRALAAAAGCLAISLLSSHLTPAAAQLVTLPGSFEVNRVGAATYAMPIAVPPGTAGVAPALTLNYNSHRRDGMLGMGWSLGGLAQVSRCSKTIAQDGARGGVNYDTNDRFCLDGQRLVAISGGYGADGTEYRSEIDSFARVISRGTAGIGPAWFEVHTKSGQILEFGHTPDSQIRVVGQTTVRAWAVSKVADTKGNYFTVTYTPDTANGQAYPARIDYTGNAAAGVQPYNSVQFTYTARPFAPTHYEAGAPIRTTQLLASVQTKAGSTVVGTYQLNYQQGTATKRSRLTSVQLCAGDGTCPPATVFGWIESGNTLTAQTNLAGANGSFNYWQPPLVGADFNGDGKADVLYYAPTNASGTLYPGPHPDFQTAYNYTGISVWLSNTSGGFTLISGNVMTFPTIWNGGCRWRPLLGDFNADGKTDVYWDACGQSVLWLSNGNGTFGTVTLNPGTGWSGQLGDFNGDGKTDILFRNSITYAHQLWFSNGNGTFSVVTNLAGLDGVYGSESYHWIARIADLNGDGKSDIFWDKVANLQVPYSLGVRKAWLSNGDGTFTVINNLGGLDGSFGPPPEEGDGNGWVSSVDWALDFNGDGKADILWNYVAPTGQSAGQRALWMSKGDGNFAVVSNLAGLDGSYVRNTYWDGETYFSNGWVPQVADFNGDGKSDIFWNYVDVDGLSLGQRKAWLSNGDGTFTVINNFGGLDGSYASPWKATVGPHTDFNGDGKADVFWHTVNMDWPMYPFSGSSRALGTTDNTLADLLRTITTGLGAVTTISYDTLSHGAIYSRDNTAVYPQADIMVPVYVVSRVDAPALATFGGSPYGTTFSWAGAKADLAGRGFLGFRQATATDLQTNFVQVTTYSQNFPFIGLVNTRAKSQGSTVVSQTANTYQFANNTGAAVVSTPSNTAAPYAVSLQSSTVGGSDLDGSPLPSVTTSYQYDAFRNPTQVVETTSDGFTKTTVNTYANDTTRWLLGRLTNTAVTKQIPPPQLPPP